MGPYALAKGEDSVNEGEARSGRHHAGDLLWCRRGGGAPRERCYPGVRLEVHIEILSAACGTTSSSTFVETVFFGIPDAGVPTGLEPPSSYDPAGDLGPPSRRQPD
jgi:hypothetical protein